ncbi:aldehyde dehydrogenase [Streptomyces eurocidicus]|uniref:Aldehyde dehydrogenase n=1 Tax=Streptomyces eurocidicus TaxID=66423 RepID=A0A2N8NSF0_STREU|nr:aldehyde dehydrogenase family protein [Streptomyces eurocidicus]MBB5121613.1 acyl-CoA reductase-like NAD-dependent aldehyde dehydrogenase [Streptomyces eurocidicus]MBF6054743.1 aldehyde dehydrogenase family protein [Streptomyces eurocidicus]PNE31697.1 aldehyde dehydrogenase [Streptomyces eurocidicus]
MTTYGHWIDGSWHAPEKGHYPIVNPATEKVVGEAPEATPAEVALAVTAARAAQDGWSRTSPRERAAVLDRMADLITEHQTELVSLLQAETGATLRLTSAMQVPVAADRFRRYAQGALEPTVIPLAPHPVQGSPIAPGGLIGAAAVRRPVGVVGCITSYNFPIVNLAGKVAPALAMGNAVVAKPAPQDPLCVLALGPLLREAGLPNGVLNIVTGSGPDAGRALVEHPGVDMISFTGSTAVGKQIAGTAGRSMKRTLMELGGKGAAIVLGDADEKAVKSAIGAVGSVWSFHSGQICTAPTRVLVHRSLYEEVVTGLTHYARTLRVGDPVDNSTVVGPLISAAQRDRVEAYIAGARAEGARIAVGGTRPDLAPGFYVAPTLITGATPDMTVAREELFGPVVVALAFDDEDEAVRIANGTSYGLHDYVFSADTARAWAFAARLRSGNVGVNTVQRHPETPFGGFKESGIGRDGGSFGLHSYSELQSLVWPS